MKIKIIIFIGLFLFVTPNFAGSVYGRDESWLDKLSEIKIGSSSKEDIERIFDSPSIETINTFTWSENIYYKTKYGKLRISYSLGNCSEESGDYNLDKGRAFDLYFLASEPIIISKLKLDLTQFESKKEDDTANWIFSNYDLGITYTLFKKKRLTSVSFGLSKAQREQYSCNNNK